MIFRTGRRFVSAGIVVLAASLTVSALPGYTIFHIGNSLTDETYGVNDAAVSLGHEGVQWGRAMSPGAPIRWHWIDQPAPSFADKLRPVTVQWGESFDGATSDYLRTTPVDVLVMQIFSGDAYLDRWTNQIFSPTIDALVGFAGCAYQANPDCQVYLYASHTMNPGTIDNSMADQYKNYPALRDTICHAYPSNKPAWIIPAPLAFNKMVQDGYGDIWSDGHTNNNGSFLLAMLFYSIIYRRDCAGATHSPSAVSAVLPSASSAYVTKAQAVAWEIARTYELSGYDAPTPVFTPYVSPAGTKAGEQAVAKLPGLLNGRTMPDTYPARVKAAGIYLIGGNIVTGLQMAR